MHIADGVLSLPVLASTALLAAGGVAAGLKTMQLEEVPKAGVLASVFFVASFIHIHVGPSSVHLLLNGLVGLLLGWRVFPALAMALLLQAILFGHGGLTALGANLLVMATPGVACYYLYASHSRKASNRRVAFLWGFSAGATAVVLTAALMALCLHLSNAQSYSKLVWVILVMHLPVLMIEAVVMGAAVSFLHRVRPEFLDRSFDLVPDCAGGDCV